MSCEEYEDFRVNYPSADTYRKALKKLGELCQAPDFKPESRYYVSDDECYDTEVEIHCYPYGCYESGFLELPNPPARYYTDSTAMRAYKQAIISAINDKLELL